VIGVSLADSTTPTAFNRDGCVRPSAEDCAEELHFRLFQLCFQLTPLMPFIDDVRAYKSIFTGGVLTVALPDQLQGGSVDAYAHA
jgi:hypothetical protein